MTSSLIISFVLTFIIEYIIIKLFFIKKKVIIPVLLVNILTNPLIVYIYNIMYIFSFHYIDIVTIVLEILVVIVEGYVYKHLLEIKWKKALIVSFITNIIAYLLGIVLSLVW